MDINIKAMTESIHREREEQYERICGYAELMIDDTREEIYSEIAKKIDPVRYENIFDQRLNEAFIKHKAKINLPSILSIDNNPKIEYIVQLYWIKDDYGDSYDTVPVPNKEDYKYRDSVIEKKIKDALALLVEYHVITEDDPIELLSDRVELISQAEDNKRRREYCRKELSGLGFSQRKIKELLDFMDRLEEYIDNMK